MICEIKYFDQLPKGIVLARSVNDKIQAFQSLEPRYKNYTVEKALITTEDKEDSWSMREFFDYVISYDEIFANEKR